MEQQTRNKFVSCKTFCAMQLDNINTDKALGPSVITKLCEI